MPNNELLYSAGGGIISDLQRDRQNGSVSIVIGLGGTGKDALKRLKNEVYRRIVPDNPGEEVPQYSRIRYLCIDTDTENLRNENDLIGLNRDTELFDISIDTSIFTDPRMKAALLDKPYAKWMNVDKVAPASNMGAGGVRQIGRYALMAHSNQLRNRLLSLFQSAASVNPVAATFVNDVNIHIMTGLGGGTGAGTFLDVCYLVQDAVSSSTALAGKNVIISGYFFTPDVNLSREVPQTVSQYIRFNSFAVLKELDYCMDFAENHGEWNQQYDGFSIRTSQSPVQVCYLISASDVKGNTFQNGYEYAMGVASDHIVQFISDTVIDMRSHISNYAKAEQIFRKPHGGNYKYVAIGASNSLIPMREMATYLASLLFGRMAAAWDRLPTETECMDFADKLNLTVDKLLNQLGPTSVPMLNIDCQWDMLPVDDNGDKYSYGYVLPETLLGPFNKEEAKVNGKIRAGREAMNNPWTPDIVLDEASADSIVCRVYKALYGVVADPERGPLYAAALLYGSNSKNLINILTGLKREASDRYDDAVNKIDLSVRAVKQARQAFNMAKTGLFNKKDKPLAFQNLLQRIKMDIDNRCQAQRLAELITALDTAMKQLRELNSEYFDRYQRVILSLRDTFAANVLAIGELVDNTGDPFTLPLFKISEMRDTLNDTVNGLDLTTVIDQFTNAFFAGAHNVWYTGDDHKIAYWLSAYMTEAFREYLNKSMDDYVRTLYPQYEADATTSRLVEAIKTDIVAKLDSMATELFLVDNNKAPHVAAGGNTIAYCAAPQTAPIINQAIEEYRKQKAATGLSYTHVTGTNDRIYFLKSSCCIPLFAYKMIDDTYDEYMRSGSSGAGKHLYETREDRADSRNWQADLPNLRPYSLYQDAAEWMGDKKADVISYNTAETIGIIHSSIDDHGNPTPQYFIWLTPDYTDRIEALKAETEKARAVSESAQKSKEALEGAEGNLTKMKDELKAYIDGAIDYTFTYQFDPNLGRNVRVKPEAEPVSIRNDGDASAPEVQKSVRRDRVLAYPELMPKVKSELAKKEKARLAMEAADAVIGQLKEEISRFSVQTNDREDYIKALVWGVLSYTMPHTITLEDKNEFGLDNIDPVVLSALHMTPYGLKAPLYQGLLNYWELPDDLKQLVAKKTGQRIARVDDDGAPHDWSGELKAATDNLKAVLSPDYMKAMQMQLMQDPKKAEINKLITDLLTTIKTTVVLYGF